MQAAGACSCLQVMGIVAGKPFQYKFDKCSKFHMIARKKVVLPYGMMCDAHDIVVMVFLFDEHWLEFDSCRLWMLDGLAAYGRKRSRQKWPCRC